MKKIAFVLLLLFTLAITAQAFALQHVDDQARVLTIEEVRKLEAQAAELYELTQFDVILHTTNNSQGKGPMDYSFDYYHGFRDAAKYPDGAALAIMFDTRDYYEAARGKGIELLTHRENYDLRDVVQSKLSDGNYYGAFSDYLRYVKRLLVPLTPMEQVTRFCPCAGHRPGYRADLRLCPQKQHEDCQVQIQRRPVHRAQLLKTDPATGPVPLPDCYPHQD